MRSGTCRSCDAPVTFVRTAKTGSWIPLDPTPVAEGNIELRLDVEHNWRVAVVVGKNNPPTPDAPLYVSHFASCKFAWKHRRAKGGQRAQ